MTLKKIRTQLNRIVKLVPNDKKPMAKNIAEELAFMTITLNQLKEHVSEHGAVDLFKNGKQEIWRESPALKAYNTTIQRYSLLSKQLMDLVPESESTEGGGNPIYDFIKNE